MGRVRHELEAGVVRFAEMLPAAPMISGADLGSCFVFSGEEGMVSRSTTFLGPLERVGTLPVGAVRASAARGRATLVDGEGGLFVVGCEGGLTRVVVPNDLLVMEGAFADEGFGVVVVDGGQTLFTNDGGESFHELAFENEVPESLRAVGGFVWIRIGQREVRVAVDGTIVEGSPPEETEGRVLTAEESATLEQAYLRELEGAFISQRFGEEWRTVTLTTGDVLSYTPGLGLAWISARDRRLTVVGDYPDRCRMQSWGWRVALVCRVDDTVYEVRWLDSPTSAPRSLFRANADRYAFSPDGKRVAFAGSCERLNPAEGDEHGRPSRDNGLCLFDTDAGVSRTLDVGDAADLAHRITFSARNQILLVSGMGNAFVVDVATNEVQTVRVRYPSAPGSEWRTGALRFTDEGVLYGAVVQERAHHHEISALYTVVGEVGSVLEPRPLPEGALDAAFRDANVGVAAGATLAELWTTSDGGRRWTPVGSIVDGEPRRVLLAGSRRNPQGSSGQLSVAYLGSLVSCRSDACVVGAKVIVSGDGPYAPPSPLPLAADGPLSARTEPAPQRRAVLDDARVSLECVDRGRAEASRNPLPVFPAQEGDARFVSENGDGATLLVESEEVEGQRVVRYQWWGSDLRGPYRARSRTAPLATIEPNADVAAAPEARALYVLDHATRQGALVQRCAGVVRCEMFWVSTSAAPRKVGAMPTSVLRMADGFAVLELEGLLQGRVLWFDSTGALLGDRAFRWHSAMETWAQRVRLVARGGKPAIMFPRGERDYVMAFDGEQRGVAEPLPQRPAPLAAVPLCDGARAPSPTAVEEIVDAVVLEAGSVSVSISLVLEHDARGSCIRGTSTRGPERAGYRLSPLYSPALSSATYALAANASGQLEGFVDDHRERRPIRCTIAAERN